jgi:hypothetical protein
LGIYYQFLFTTNDDEEILRIVDFWEPISKNHRAQSNQHFIIGVERWIGEGFTGSIEAYFKPYSSLLDNNPANNPADESDDYITGKGTARGVELLLKKTSGKLTGWLGYSYSFVEKRIDLNNDGRVIRSQDEIYSPNYHRPHVGNLVLNYQINAKNSISLTWSLSSGQPYTPVIGKVYTQGGYGGMENPYSQLTTIYGRKNSARYPAYYRGDIGWTREIKFFGWRGRFKVQVINFTNHFNALFYSWDHSRSPRGCRPSGCFRLFQASELNLSFKRNICAIILAILAGGNLFLSCERQLDLSLFRDEYGEYEPEVRIEAVINPIFYPSSGPPYFTVIVRIDRSITIDEHDGFQWA